MHPTTAISTHITTPSLNQPQARNETAEKIKCFFARVEGIGTLFSILSGVAIATLWGVPYGLLAAGIGIAISFVIAQIRRAAPAVTSSISVPVTDSVPVTEPETVSAPVGHPQLDPNLQLHPAPNNLPFNASVDQRAHLMSFTWGVQVAILRKSPHYNMNDALYWCLKDRFDGMDYSQLTLLHLAPVRFNGGIEGYKIVIQSEQPQGWIQLYIPKDNPGDLWFENVENPEQIEQVTPFLDRRSAERNHFESFDLPIDPLNLMAQVETDQGDIDLLQVHLTSVRPVRFEWEFPPTNQVNDGYEVVLDTPNGPVIYCANDYTIAHSTQARNIVAREEF